MANPSLISNPNLVWFTTTSNQSKTEMMKNIINFVLLFGFLGLSFAKPMPQEAAVVEEDEEPMKPMPVSSGP